MTTSTPHPHAVPLEAQKRVKQIVVEGLRLQLTRDVLTAARAAQEPGQPLEKYIRAQCTWRGIDPTPYLAQAEEGA